MENILPFLLQPVTLAFFVTGLYAHSIQRKNIFIIWFASSFHNWRWKLVVAIYVVKISQYSVSSNATPYSDIGCGYACLPFLYPFPSNLVIPMEEILKPLIPPLIFWLVFSFLVLHVNYMVEELFLPSTTGRVRESTKNVLSMQIAFALIIRKRGKLFGPFIFLLYPG